MNKETLWESTLAELQLNLSEANFKTWFKGKTGIVDLDQNLISIGCNSPYIKNWIESRYHTQVKTILEKITGESFDLIFTVDTNVKSVVRKSSVKGSDKVRPYPTVPLFSETSGGELQEVLSKARLNPSFNFANFIVGSSNQLAHAVAKAVSENPTKNYNPYYIYGGVGVGKTHLIQAIGQEALSKNPQLKIIYCTCEEFTNELVAAIQTKTTLGFRNRFRSADLLLIDDVQFLSGRESTQEEVFHTFNMLVSSGKQVVLSSDRPPSAIKKLSVRLQSRFEGGIIADIGSPEADLREAIVRLKSHSQGIDLPSEIVQKLASIFSNNIRELEGGLVRLITYSKLTNRPISKALVTEVAEISMRQSIKETKPAAVIEAAAKYFSLPVSTIRGRGRAAAVVQCRQFVMYILRVDLNLPLAEIASLLNKADHTSVLYSVNKVEGELKKSAETREKLVEIRECVFT